MADTLNKPKLQSVISVNGGSKTPPSPAAKLMLNHGKPNFTIQRSPKVQENGNSNPLSPQANGNNNYNAFRSANSNNTDIVVKSTKFNGVFKPSNISINEKQPHQQQNSENEAAKVVLRRPKVSEVPLKEGEDENVPEFIRRQRRIQERLAKENVLDFENRRSGYFTHVMISPSSPNRTSFVETMSSPATIAALEIPPPSSPIPASAQTPTVVEEEERQLQVETNGTTNGHAAAEEEEEEEVAKAIEEVNKAVAGEDDDRSVDAEAVVVATPAVATLEQEEKQNGEIVTIEEQKQEEPVMAVPSTLEFIETTLTPVAAEEKAPIAAADLAPEVALAVAAAAMEESKAAPVENGTAAVNEEAKQNGHATTNGDVTISHTNGSLDGPSLPTPDPSGALGVNYEPKTVVSFSKEMGEPNKYPDTVKVVKEGSDDDTVKTPGADAELQELAKLKFDIKADEQDVQVTPVLRAE